MSKLLVHIHSDLEFKNKVTLGLMIALAAEKKGHEVTLFLAADGVNIPVSYTHLTLPTKA